MARRYWWVYLLRCADGTFYTGMTLDLTRRLAEHNAGPRGARYTRARRPVQLLWSWRCRDRVAAMRLELRIKRLPRARKEALARGEAVLAAPAQRSLRPQSKACVGRRRDLLVDQRGRSSARRTSAPSCSTVKGFCKNPARPRPTTRLTVSRSSKPLARITGRPGRRSRRAW